MEPSVFGSPWRDRVLAVLVVKGETHVREVAAAFGAAAPTVARAVRSLEADGLIVALQRGTTRVLHLNLRWYATPELRALLERTADVRPKLYQPLAAVRTRPRRSGKPL